MFTLPPLPGILLGEGELKGDGTKESGTLVGDM